MIYKYDIAILLITDRFFANFYGYPFGIGAYSDIVCISGFFNQVFYTQSKVLLLYWEMFTIHQYHCRKKCCVVNTKTLVS